MSGTGYDRAQSIRTYSFMAAAIDTIGVFGRFQGPAGKLGRVIGVEYHLVAATTVAASNLDFDTVAGLTGPCTVNVPIASINTGGAATAAELKAGAELPADTIVQCSSDGGSTAGDADVHVTVQWY